MSSTKSAHGHALGAAGAIEAAATALALRHGVLPATLNFTSPGDGCDLDYIPNEVRAVRRRGGAVELLRLRRAQCGAGLSTGLKSGASQFKLAPDPFPIRAKIMIVFEPWMPEIQVRPVR